MQVIQQKKLNNYEDGEYMDVSEVYEKWLEHANEEIAEELKGYSEKEIEDSFYKDLYLVK